MEKQLGNTMNIFVNKKVYHIFFLKFGIGLTLSEDMVIDDKLNPGCVHSQGFAERPIFTPERGASLVQQAFDSLRDAGLPLDFGAEAVRAAGQGWGVSWKQVGGAQQSARLRRRLAAQRLVRATLCANCGPQTFTFRPVQVLLIAGAGPFSAAGEFAASLTVTLFCQLGHGHTLDACHVRDAALGVTFGQRLFQLCRTRLPARVRSAARVLKKPQVLHWQLAR